jgi:hypothetical protein
MEEELVRRVSSKVMRRSWSEQYAKMKRGVASQDRMQHWKEVELARTVCRNEIRRRHSG